MFSIKSALGALVVMLCLSFTSAAAAQSASTYGSVPNAGGVVVSPSGDVFAVDSNTGAISRIAPGGATTAYTTGVGSGTYMLARAGDGTLYAAREGSNQLYRVPASCVAPCTPVLMATPSRPFGMAVDAAGTLYLASFVDQTIVRYAAGCAAPCTPTTFATGLGRIADLTFDSAGDLYAVTEPGTVLKFNAGCGAPCTPTTYATGAGSGGRGITVGEAGSFYTTAVSSKAIYRIPAGGGAAVLFGTYPTWSFPIQIDRNPSGTILYVATVNSGSGVYAVSLPAPPVPTMSEWAMILLGLTLAGGAAVLVQRRRMVA